MTRPQSIHDFIIEEQKGVQGSENETVKNLYNEWIAGIDCSVVDFRLELDTWFMKCYSVMCKNIQIETDVRVDIEDVLKEEFYTAVNGGELGVKAESIFRDISFSEFMEKVVKCVEREQDLIIKYKAKEDRAKCLKTETFDQRIKEAEVVRKKLQTVLDVCAQQLNESHEVETKAVQLCLMMVQTLYTQLAMLSSELKTNVGTWLKSFQLKYAELAVPSDFDDRFKQISQRCGVVGRVLHDTLSMLKHEVWTSVMSQSRGEAWCRMFHKLWHDFLNSTFIVTKQSSYCVKTLRKNFPEFEISMLAAACIPRKEKVTVKAMFVLEDDIKDATIDDITSWESKSLKLLSNTKATNLGTSPLVFQFDKIQFKDPFKRKPKDQMSVHEEKYRLLFHLNFEQNTFWTWSMPVVVTTASNQDASSLASIMWQCFSTGVFVFPTNIPEKLHWDRIAEMLQLKLQKLTLKHTLTQENLDHLKYRLCGGTTRVPEDEYVSLNRFCQEAMTYTRTVDCKHGFSFWKWFIACYNLLERYLLPYWENGLIAGFIKKVDAMNNLSNECFPPGTFILRFSETELDYKDSITEIYGRLTTVVKLSETDAQTAVECFNETEGSKKRKIFENDTGDKFDFINAADSEKLTKDTLAHILMYTRSEYDRQKPAYMYTYPSSGTVKTLFCRLAPEAINAKKKGKMSKYTDPTTIEIVNVGNSFGTMNINEPSRNEDHTSDGKRPRLDQEHGDTFESSIVTPSFNANGVASPALDFDIGNRTNMAHALPEDVQKNLRGLANFLSGEQLNRVTGWVSENYSRNTNWPIK